ncbi:MAG: elongation factor Ts [Candidatus Saccharibacteria bacterium]|nr:elongation factor Ts [Candidatus Saccharibacteria bacterium]
MGVSIDDIRKLKELSGIGLTDAKAALVDAKGDFDKALAELRKKGVTKAEKKGNREARQGLIDGYIHNGRIGVLVEVNCETDFVARTDNFKAFVHEIALQVASMSPQYVSEEDIPADEMKRVENESMERVKAEGKPADIAKKIVEGQVKKYFAEKVLLEQVFIKNEKQTVKDFVKENISKTGENLIIRQFKRIELGVSE